MEAVGGLEEEEIHVLGKQDPYTDVEFPLVDEERLLDVLL